MRYSQAIEKRPYTSDELQTEGSEGLVSRLQPGSPIEFGGFRGRGQREPVTLGLRYFEDLPLRFSVLFFCAVPGSKAFVTGATLRSGARKNCLQGDEGEK